MDCINPVALALLSYYPLPNANLGALNPSYNYETLVPNPANSNGFDVRVDHNFNSKQQVYVRYSFKNALYSEFNSAGVVAPASNFLPNDEAHDQNRSLVASYNYAITPTLVNEFRFGFTNYNENDTFPIEGASAITKLGLVFDHPIGIASHPTADTFPNFNFADGSVTTIGQDRVGSTISGNVQFTDNVTKNIGEHTLRFGIDARREHFNSLMYFAPSDDYGDFTFSGNLTDYSFGDFLLGMPSPSYFAVIGPQMDARAVHWGVYGQDTWQLNRHLTRQFRIAVGTASAVSGKQWRYSYLSYFGKQPDRRRSGQVPSIYQKQFAPPADQHRLSSGIQRMFASNQQPVTVFERRNGEPGGASSGPSGLELA